MNLELIIIFFADLKENVKINYICDEGKLKWISFNETIYRKMPLTAQKVIEHYLETGIYTEDFYSVIVADENVSIISMGAS